MSDYTPKQRVKVFYDDKSQIKHFLDCIEDVNLIPLQSDSAFIFENSRMKVTSDKIILIDRKNDQLGIFDQSGKFLFSIANKGNGPSDYINIGNIFVSDSSVCVYDNVKANLLYYDLYNSGNFIKSKHLDCNADEVECLNDTLFAAYTKDLSRIDKDKSGIRLINADGKVTKTFLPLPKWISNSSESLMSASLNKNNTEFLLSPVWSYNVFSITPDSVYCRYYLDFGKHSIPEEYLIRNQDRAEEDFMDFIREIINKDWVLFVDNFQESLDYIYFMSIKGRDTYYTLFKKNTKETYTVGIKYLPEAWSYLLIPFKAMKNNTFYTMVSVEALDEFMKIDFEDSRLIKIKNQYNEFIKNSRTAHEAEDYVCISFNCVSL